MIVGDDGKLSAEDHDVKAELAMIGMGSTHVPNCLAVGMLFEWEIRPFHFVVFRDEEFRRHLVRVGFWKKRNRDLWEDVGKMMDALDEAGLILGGRSGDLPCHRED